MKEVFYKKVGRKYVPVSEYDENIVRALPYGSHLIDVRKNGRTTISKINPNFAAMIAAGLFSERKISESIMKSLAIRPTQSTMTEEQKVAWDAFFATLEDTKYPLQWPSIFEAVREGVRVMQEEADALMQNPNVKQAHEHFLTLCELSK
jgi:hypothetical protein